MPHPFSKQLLTLIALMLLLVGPASAWQTLEFDYAPAAIDNPLKGLVPYQQPEEGRFPHSMEFNYLPLSKLVVDQDQYDFSPLEELLEDVRSRGNQTVFRIFLEFPGQKNCIPKYLLDGGLKVHIYENTNTHPFPPTVVETPDYEDAKLRDCLRNFIAELGKRYDGDPRVAYITAGLLGTWGEWHTYPRDELWASKEVQREVMDAYESAFNKTPILLRYPAADKEDWSVHAANQKRNFGYHDDSFAHSTLATDKNGEDWFFQNALQNADAEEKWKTHPIGGEIRPEVWGCCFDKEPCTRADQSFADCRDQLHVTWLMDTGMFQEQANESRLRIAKREVQKLGYEFFVETAVIQEVENGFQVSVSIKNTGIAPFYHPGWTIQVGLAAVVGQEEVPKRKTEEPPGLKKWKTDWELVNILPGETKSFSTTIETQSKVGQVLLGLPNPMEGGKPLRFANRNQDQDLEGWLSLGEPRGDNHKR